MTNSLDFLGKTIDTIIDRPLGSKHPKHNFIYSLNYGFVPNTISGDNEEMDCYILGIYEPIKTFKGKCIAIIHRLNDLDDKLIIVPENINFTNLEIKALTKFQERFFNSIIIREENYIEFNKNIPELSVSNINKSKEFYNFLGFKINYERPEDKFAFISLNEIQFMIQEISENSKWDLNKLIYPYGNGVNFQLEITNIDLLYNKLKNSNYNITFNLEENWYKQNNFLLGNKEFLIQDPDGYLLRFSEDIGKKELN